MDHVSSSKQGVRKCINRLTEKDVSKISTIPNDAHVLACYPSKKQSKMDEV